MSDDRKLREKYFHDERFGGGDEIRKEADKYYISAVKAYGHYETLILDGCYGKRLLEYGCGTGSKVFFWAQNGAHVSGIDISSEAIKLAKEATYKEGAAIKFYVMDAENLEFENDSFDIVVGSGILHHLDLVSSYAELSRVLHEGGRAIFIEPLGHNPLINVYRWLTPSMRTSDEHPLLMKDIDLAKQYFNVVDIKYFNLFALMAVPFRKYHGFFKAMLIFLNAVDQTLMTWFPFLRRFAWLIVVELRSPKKAFSSTAR